MKSTPKVSLKYLVPLVIILLAILVIGFQYFTTKPVLLRAVEDNAKADTQALLSRVQGPIEILLRYENLDAAKSIIASFGAEQGLESLFLVDAKGYITAATKLNLLNRQWLELSEYQDSKIVADVLDKRTTASRISEDEQHVFGYSSICADKDAQIIRPKGCGFLYYRQNISNKKTIALNQLNNEIIRESLGIAFAAILVWLVVHLRLTRRVEQLITTGKRFAQGDQAARSRIKGTDELADLGNTFDLMFDQIVADEKLLSKSKERLDSIIETSVEGIITIDDTGAIQSINSAAEKIFAYSTNELIGNNVKILMPSPYQQEHDSYIKNYIEGGEAKVLGIGREVEGRRKDGTKFAMWLTVGEFFENERRFFTGFVQDISAFKKSQELLRLVNASATQSNDAIIITTRQLEQPGPEIVFVNPAFTKITGYSEAEVLGKTPRILQGPKTDKNTLKQLKQALQMGEPWSGEAINYRKDGSAFYMQWSIDAIRNEVDEITHWVSVFRDVTEDKKSQELLRLREEEFQLIFENAPTGVAIMDLDGKYINVNPPLCDILGYSKPELLDLSYIDITHPDDIEISKEYLHKLISGELSGYSIEKRYIRKDNKVISVVLNIALVNESVALAHDEKGNPALLITHILDITNEIEAEERVRSQQEQLAHMDRVSMMGEMAAGIAHEINQPLTAIDSYAQAAQRRIQFNDLNVEKLKVLLEKISNTSRRAGYVVSHLRAIMTKQTRKHNKFSINSLIDDVVKILETDVRVYEFRIKLEHGKDLPNVMADSIQIQQVLLNLIRNAMDAAANEIDQYKEIIISSSLLTEEDRIKVSVKDYGSGVDENAAEQLFNPFFTTKQTGLGMGLSICKSIIQSHGGSLWFLPNADKGTTFHFTLPTALEENE